MENMSFTPGDIMALCNFILAISAVAGLIYSMLRRVNAPNELQDQKIKELEKRLELHEKQFAEIAVFLKRDKERLDEIESVSRVTNCVIIKTLQVLVRHGISGDNRDELIQADKELNKYLLNERWGHKEEDKQ